MRKIDFLSFSPKSYIFQKEAYKTNFGGVLFLIYCTVMLIISISYILDYSLNEKVEIEYLKYLKTNVEELSKLNSDPNYNPTLEFQIGINVNISFNPYLMDNISLIYIKENKFYISNEFFYESFEGDVIKVFPFKSRISDYDIFLSYSCGNDSNCSIKVEKEVERPITFQFRYPFALIDYDNPSNPFLENNIYKRGYQYTSNFQTFKS